MLEKWKKDVIREKEFEEKKYNEKVKRVVIESIIHREKK